MAADQETDTTITLVEPSIGTGHIQRTVLPGGLRVVTEAVPGTRSAAFGITTGLSSRDEPAEYAGSSHFLEHLLYKGTPTRTALDVSRQLEETGCTHNAATSHNQVLFYVEGMDVNLPAAIDILADMILHSTLDEVEVDRERAVITHEIGAKNDRPEFLLQTMARGLLYGGHPLGRPNLGTIESIQALPLEQIRDQYERAYAPHRLVVAATGAVDHAGIVDQVQKLFADRLAQAGPVRPARPRPSVPGLATYQGTEVFTRSTDLAHLMLALEGLPATDPRLPALEVLHEAVAGGMSSRVFQQVREERGLAYRISSYLDVSDDTGLVACYLGCAPRQVDEVLGLVVDINDQVAAQGLEPAEIAKAKAQLQGKTVRYQQTALAKLLSRFSDELHLSRPLGLGEQLERIEKVTEAQVAEVAAQVLTRPHSLAVVGPFDQDRCFAPHGSTLSRPLRSGS